MKKTLITLLLGLACSLALAAEEVPLHPYIEIVTTEGTIILELDGKQAPITVGHFLKLVGAEGFEPPTLCSQSRCATRLRHAPMPDFLPRHHLP